jgi:hypothetical protein
MSQINKVHTPCKDCVFSIYEDITQTDCHLKYIDKYRDKNIEILEAYDNEKEFYVINGKKCIGYRESKWFKQFGLENSPIQDKVNKFTELNHLSYMIVIDLKYFTLKHFNHLIEEVKKISISPEKIIFIRYQDNKDFTYDIIKNLLDKIKLGCKWRIQTMVDNSLDNKDILHNCINLNKQHRFILSINKPANNIYKIIDKANYIVYEDLDQFNVISNKDKTALIFSAPSYRWSIVVEKINILDDDNNYQII